MVRGFDPLIICVVAKEQGREDLGAWGQLYAPLDPSKIENETNLIKRPWNINKPNNISSLSNSFKHTHTHTPNTFFQTQLFLKANTNNSKPRRPRPSLRKQQRRWNRPLRGGGLKNCSAFIFFFQALFHRKLKKKKRENPQFTLNYRENSGFPGFFPGVFSNPCWERL